MGGGLFKTREGILGGCEDSEKITVKKGAGPVFSEYK
jgi:hypothetical protein